MKSHPEVAKVLRDAISHRKVSQAQLHEEAGISQRTLTNVLSGDEDFKLSTLFALADKYDLVIASDECYSDIYFDEAK